MVAEAGLDLRFRPGIGENNSVAAVETGSKQQSTGLLHLNGLKSLRTYNEIIRYPKWDI